MKVCFPVERNEGVSSQVFEHFGSAPVFLVVETETQAVTAVVNRDQHHAHGQCSPLRALGGAGVDAVVVGGIGRGALNGLTRAGVQVFRAAAGSVAENLRALGAQALTPWSSDDVCGGHGHGHGCAH